MKATPQTMGPLPHGLAPPFGEFFLTQYIGIYMAKLTLCCSTLSDCYSQYSKRPTLLCTRLCPWNHLKRPLSHAHTYPQRCRVRAQATATLTTLANPRMYIDNRSVRVSRWGPCGTSVTLGSLIGFIKPRMHASCSSRAHGLGYAVLHYST